MTIHYPRRQFLRTSSLAAIGAFGSGTLGSCLPPVSAEEVSKSPATVTFAADIEPLVKLLEETSREEVVDQFIRKIKSGVSYQNILAALQLAGIRNVQPRPSVGFKFHSVLVVNSAHLASQASPQEQRWLPILWAIDYFKSAQQQDVRENDWTMSSVDESRVPKSQQAESQFVMAMDAWDESSADVAIAGLVRTAGATRIFDLLVRYGVRDFRSIGHKAIFVANAWRALQTIGWRHSEPILRSLAYALLNYDGTGIPRDRDELADRPGRENAQRCREIRAGWLDGRLDEGATTELLGAIRADDYQNVCKLVVQQLNAGVSPQSVWDAMFAAAGEMLIRQPGIVSLHTLTTTNAMRYAFDNCGDDETRKLTLLQNAAFLPLFREEMKKRGEVGNQRIDRLSVAENAAVDGNAVSRIFELVGKDNAVACEASLGYLNSGGDPAPLMDAARVLVFRKGTDSHDYKFSAAVLEDYFHVSPTWRNRCLAASVYKMRGQTERDNPLMSRVAKEIS